MAQQNESSQVSSAGRLDMANEQDGCENNFGSHINKELARCYRACGFTRCDLSAVHAVETYHANRDAHYTQRGRVVRDAAACNVASCNVVDHLVAVVVEVKKRQCS